ncbi:MAG: phosphotransferase [bacterium]
MQIADSLLKTQSDTFQTILNDFIQSPEFAALGIGEVENVNCLTKFDRKYSVQRLYQVQGTEQSKNIYVKIAKNVYKKSPEEFNAVLQQDFDTNLFWFEKLSGYKQFGSIRPLYLSLPFKALVTEETIGRNLGELVRTQLRFSPSHLIRQVLQDHVHNAGRLLHVVQNEYEGEQDYDLQTLVEDVDLRMRALVQNRSSHFSREMRQAILNFVDKNMSLAKSQNLLVGYMHRDFTMSNLLVSGPKIIVHDFAKIDIGPRLFDVTRFYHHLGLLKYKPVYSSNIVAKLQQAFLEGCNLTGATNNILFNFFMLRHYVTHYKGLIRDRELSLKSKLYDHWVMKKHLQYIDRIIKRNYTK